jgi:hypothetical protein
MQFLRVNGPDINLNEVFQGIDSDGNSSSLSDATSFDEERLRFIVARRHCATMTLFHGKVLPSLASSMISPSDTIRIKTILMMQTPSKIKFLPSQQVPLDWN